MYDEVISLQYPAGVMLLAFADDFALILDGQEKDAIEENNNKSVEIIRRWHVNRSLHLAA